MLAVGGLLGFYVSGRRLAKGIDPMRLAAYGALAGLPAFSAVIFSAPLDAGWLFRLGALGIGFGGGLFAVGTLCAAMRMEGQFVGLALGAWGAVQSAAAGQISLAIPLVIGFALHNATEGFGIVGPMAGEAKRPTWGFLAILGFIGGGPTLVGTLLGQSFVNDTVSVAFLALAAGSILYVVVQLLRVAQNLGHRTLMYWGLLAGLMLGFGTDFVIAAVGA